MTLDLQKIKPILENQLCSVHNQNPIIDIENNDIMMKTCCEEFRLQLSELAKKESETQLINNTMSFLDEIQARFQKQ